MVATLYVARHGLRANADPSPTGIDGDPRLTTEGVLQAEELANHILALSKQAPVQALYSSPFYRCIETARPSSEALGLPVLVERGLSEHYAPGRPTKPVPWLPERSKQAFFPMIDLQYNSQVSVSPSGETRDDLRARVRKALDAVFAHADEHNFRRIVIFTHAAIKITIAETLAGVEPRAGTCSLDTFVNQASNGESPRWALRSGADTSFLSGGEQMHWSFDMAVEAGSAADEASRTSTKSAPELGGSSRVLADGSVLPGVASAEKTAVTVDQTTKSEADLVGKTGKTGETPVGAENRAADSEPGSDTSTLLVSLDTSALASDDLPKNYTASDIHLVNVDCDRPIVQIGAKVYEGEWQHAVGTEVYTSPNGELVGHSRHQIRLRNVLTEPVSASKPLMERL